MHVWPLSPRVLGDVVEHRAKIEFVVESGMELWYRIPHLVAESTETTAEPFLIGTVFAAMRRGEPLHIHGCVSPRLLANLEEFQTVWSRWRPDLYHRVEMYASEEIEGPAGSRDGEIGRASCRERV